MSDVRDRAIEAATKLLIDALNSQLYPIESRAGARELAASMIGAYEKALSAGNAADRGTSRPPLTPTTPKLNVP